MPPARLMSGGWESGSIVPLPFAIVVQRRTRCPHIVLRRGESVYNSGRDVAVPSRTRSSFPAASSHDTHHIPCIPHVCTYPRTARHGLDCGNPTVFSTAATSTPRYRDRTIGCLSSVREYTPPAAPWRCDLCTLG